MTDATLEHADRGQAVAETFTEVKGTRIFSLQARVEAPRGLVLALHGGGYDANYWHHPGYPDASLLTMAAALGYDAVAVDRPGIARSAEGLPAGLSVPDQSNLLFGLIERERAGNCPVYVIGHSLGGITALTMADDPRAPETIAGIEVSGVPVRFPAERDAEMRAGLDTVRQAGETHGGVMDREARRAMFFGEPGSYDEALVAWGSTEHSVAIIEMDDVVAWPSELPRIAGGMSIPLQWTTSTIENSSEAGPDVLEEVQAMFAASRHARFETQEASGHNISLHHVARAYHLRALAFFEAVAAMNRGS